MHEPRNTLEKLIGVAASRKGLAQLSEQDFDTILALLAEVHVTPETWEDTEDVHAAINRAVARYLDNREGAAVTELSQLINDIRAAGHSDVADGLETALTDESTPDNEDLEDVVAAIRAAGHDDIADELEGDPEDDAALEATSRRETSSNDDTLDEMFAGAVDDELLALFDEQPGDPVQAAAPTASFVAEMLQAAAGHPWSYLEPVADPEDDSPLQDAQAGFARSGGAQLLEIYFSKLGALRRTQSTWRPNAQCTVRLWLSGSGRFSAQKAFRGQTKRDVVVQALRWAEEVVQGEREASVDADVLGLLGSKPRGRYAGPAFNAWQKKRDERLREHLKKMKHQGESGDEPTEPTGDEEIEDVVAAIRAAGHDDIADELEESTPDNEDLEDVVAQIRAAGHDDIADAVAAEQDIGDEVIQQDDAGDTGEDQPAGETEELASVIADIRAAGHDDIADELESSEPAEDLEDVVAQIRAAGHDDIADELEGDDTEGVDAVIAAMRHAGHGDIADELETVIGNREPGYVAPDGYEIGAEKAQILNTANSAVYKEMMAALRSCLTTAVGKHFGEAINTIRARFGTKGVEEVAASLQRQDWTGGIFADFYGDTGKKELAELAAKSLKQALSAPAAPTAPQPAQQPPAPAAAPAKPQEQQASEEVINLDPPADGRQSADSKEQAEKQSVLGSFVESIAQAGHTQLATDLHNALHPAELGHMPFDKAVELQAIIDEMKTTGCEDLIPGVRDAFAVV